MTIKFTFFYIHVPIFLSLKCMLSSSIAFLVLSSLTFSCYQGVIEIRFRVLKVIEIRCSNSISSSVVSRKQKEPIY